MFLRGFTNGGSKNIQLKNNLVEPLKPKGL